MTREERLRQLAEARLLERKIDRVSERVGRPQSIPVELSIPPITNQVNPTPIENLNFVQTPINNVDTAPIGNAVAAIVERLTANVEQALNAMLSQQQETTEALAILGRNLSALIAVLSSQKAPINKFIVPKDAIRVELPAMTSTEESRPRKATITHEDGTTSTVEIEG